MNPPGPSRWPLVADEVKTRVYAESQECRYRIDNPWQQPLGRLADHLRPYTIPPQSYVAAEGGHLVCLVGVAQPCRILHETTPFLRLGGRSALLLAARRHLFATETIPTAVMPLVDFRGWHRLYFHWFLDLLPRVLVAEWHRRHSGAEVRLLVPERLNAWQAESLARLATSPDAPLQVRHRPGSSNIRTQALLAASSHRHQHATEAPFDAISPRQLRQLARRLKAGATQSGPQRSGLPRRLFVSRQGANSRRIANEQDVAALLEKHGFSTIQLEKLSLSEQINLFENATHIIAVHGAGLTNLLYATQCTVLELFASEHGIRPDFFQIASILQLAYFFYCLPSMNEFHDIHLPLELVDDFLAIAPP